jgi:hypothetical protein
MPLKLNVGLSRKVGEPHFGSRGASVNLELELESAVVDSPDRLRDHIRHLFRLAKASIDEELGAATPPGNGAHPTQNGDQPHAAPDNGNSHTSDAVRRATPSRVRAIHAIARRQGLDLGPLLRQRFEIDRPELLSVQDASALIDDLETRTAGDPTAGCQR